MSTNAGEHEATQASEDTAGTGFGFEDLREEFEGAEQRFRALVQERPIASFLTAVAAGYLIARFIRR